MCTDSVCSFNLDGSCEAVVNQSISLTFFFLWTTERLSVGGFWTFWNVGLSQMMERGVSFAWTRMVLNDLVSQPIDFCVSIFRNFCYWKLRSVLLKDISLSAWANASLSFIRFWIWYGNAENNRSFIWKYLFLILRLCCVDLFFWYELLRFLGLSFNKILKYNTLRVHSA